MDKRFRYPEHFNTKREMLWYIKGLMDAKTTAEDSINTEIDRYRNSIPFTEFKWDKEKTKERDEDEINKKREKAL